MPFRSRAQWGWAFATDQPFARRWARETPGGKGRRYRRLAKKLKGANYGARAGGVIVGNLARGGDGKFTAAGNAGAAPAKAPKAPKQTPEQRAQEAEDRHQETRRANEASVGAQAGLGANLSDALMEFASPDEAIALAPANAAELERAGMVERGRDGQPRLTAAGRSYAAAARAGDVRRAADAISTGRDRVAAASDRQTARDRRKAEIEAKKREREEAKKKPKGGGGGGGGGQDEARRQEADARRQAADQDRAKRRQEADARRVQADQERATRREEIAARRAQTDARRAEADARRVRADAARQERGQRELSDLAQQAEAGARLSDEQWRRLAVEGLAQREGGMIALTDAGRAQARRSPQAAKAFQVFKDASGAYRWIAVSSTSFRDRDGEIVSTKALADDCERADRDGRYGPLRWWHCPGVDIGDCDYNAVSGRSLIEMGTFRHPELARAAAAAAPDLSLSLGFHHRPDEPSGPDRAYSFIRRFERSLIPRGRASNPYTAFAVTKEETSMTPEKLKAALEKLGGSPEARAVMQDIIAAAQTREKEADAAGVAYKEAEATAEKAPMPPAEMIEAGATEVADGEAEAEPEADDMMLTDAEITMIADRVAERLMGAIEGISAKMAAVDEELKGRGYQRMKEYPDQLEAVTATVTAIKATVDELNGVRPARPHRPTLDNQDLPPELAQALKGELASGDPLASVMQFLRPAP